MDSFSPFDPVHEELISFLKSKVSGTGIQVPAGVVYDGTKSAYRCPPWSLRELGLTGSDPEFFCYFSEPETYDGDRSKCRPGETSYWKTTEPPFGVLNGGRVVGIVEILTYYHFHEPTESVMFEYRLVHDQDLANAPKSVADNDEEKVYTIFLQISDPPQRNLMLKKHHVRLGVVKFKLLPSGCFIRVKLSSVQASKLADEESVVVLLDGWPVSRSRLAHDQDLANAPKDDGLVLCKIFWKHGVPRFPYNQPSPTYSDHDEEKFYTIFMQIIDPLQRNLMLEKHHVRLGVVEFGLVPSGCFIRVKLSSVQAFKLADEESVFVLLDGWPISRSSDSTGYYPCTTSLWGDIGFLDEIHVVSSPSHIIVAIIDSGISPESPSFSDKGYPPPPSRFAGYLEEESVKGFSRRGFFEKHRKIVVARIYPCYDDWQDDYNDSAEDAIGHGTMVASIIAGSPVRVNYHNIKEGEAQGGFPCCIAVYKVLYRIRLPDGSYTIVTAPGGIMKAFQDAISDKVDVIAAPLAIISELDGLGNYKKDSMLVGSFLAMKAGIPTIAGAGNGGENEESLKNAAPWLITVGASNNVRIFEAVIVLEDDSKTTIKARALNVCDTFYGCVLEELTEEMILAGDFKCLVARVLYYEGSNLRKAIDLCVSAKSRGLIHRYEHKQPYVGAEKIPTAYVSSTDGAEVQRYIHQQHAAGEYARVTISFSKLVEGDRKFTPTRSSAKGPNTLCKYILKPNLCATGSDILAAATHNKYATAYGTSPACAVIASYVAFIKHHKPDWSPARIASVLMTTASPMSREHLSDFMAMGAGMVGRREEVLNPGLVFDCSVDDFAAFLHGQGLPEDKLRSKYEYNGILSENQQVDPWDLNLPSFVVPIPLQNTPMLFKRTVTCVGGPGVYNACILDIYSLGELEVFEVEPSILKFDEEEQTKEFILKIVKSVDCSEPRMYSLQWCNGVHSVRCPILLHKDKLDGVLSLQDLSI